MIPWELCPLSVLQRWKLGLIQDSNVFFLFPVKSSFKGFPPMSFQYCTKATAGVGFSLVFYWFFAGSLLSLPVNIRSFLLITFWKSLMIFLFKLFCHVPVRVTNVVFFFLHLIWSVFALVPDILSSSSGSVACEVLCFLNCFVLKNVNLSGAAVLTVIMHFL